MADLDFDEAVARAGTIAQDVGYLITERDQERRKGGNPTEVRNVRLSLQSSALTGAGGDTEVEGGDIILRVHQQLWRSSRISSWLGDYSNLPTLSAYGKDSRRF